MVRYSVRRRDLIGRVAIVFGLVAAAPRFAAAQPAASLDRHQPAVLPTDGFGVDSAETTGSMRWSASMQLDYANDPAVLEVRRPTGGNTLEANRVVADQLRGHFVGALTLADRVIVFAGLPVDFVLMGLTNSTGPYVPKASGPNLGDPYVGVRLRLFGSLEDTFMLAFQGSVAFPLAQAIERPTWSGDSTLSGRAHLLPQFNFGIARLVLDAGVNLRRSQQYPGSALESEFSYGAGLTIRPHHTRLGIVAELRGAVSLLRPENRNETALEAIAGVRYHGDSGIVFGAAGGAGLTNALGTPEWRALLTLGYQTNPANRDSDHDGIRDTDDRCPNEAEDRDGVEDDDGCPEDNDGDGVADAADHCPNEAEDRDGFQDDDGCPEPDNDGDGVADADDHCPNEAEDRDGFQDEDGCPDADNDDDQVADASDGAPNDPEDRDGFQDEDGVPDPDNDSDSVPDTLDVCANEAGPVENNGCPDRDRDGDTVVDRLDNCPDEAGSVDNHGCAVRQLVQITEDRISIAEKVFFATGRATIQSRSFGLLDNVVAVLRAHPEIAHVRIEGHTDDRGNVDNNMRLSQSRAQAVLDYLVSHGIEASRLRAIGYGPSQPIVPNARTRAELEQNRRVEFMIERD